MLVILQGSTEKELTNGQISEWTVYKMGEALSRGTGLELDNERYF